MSWWDKYFAPGDVRRHQQKLQHEQPQPLTPESEVLIVRPPTFHPPQRLPPAERAKRQNAMFYGGIGFTVLSAVVTRRALQRKQAQVLRAQALAQPPLPSLNPKLQPSPAMLDAAAAAAEGPKVDGPLEAIQALGYATLNVFSFAMLSAGAAMKYFDVADIEDLRRGIRGIAGEAGFVDEEESEREIEGWVSEVLARRHDGKEIGVAELERRVQTEREIERQIETEKEMEKRIRAQVVEEVRQRLANRR